MINLFEEYFVYQKFFTKKGKEVRSYPLIGYYWVSRTGIQKMKPPYEELLGVEVLHPDGTLGVIPPNEIDNWEDLPISVV